VRAFINAPCKPFPRLSLVCGSPHMTSALAGSPRSASPRPTHVIIGAVSIVWRPSARWPLIEDIREKRMEEGKKGFYDVTTAVNRNVVPAVVTSWPDSCVPTAALMPLHVAFIV